MLDINNYYERLVTDHLWKLIESSQQAISQAFLEDVACLALNQLPVCYVRSSVDKSNGLTDADYQTMNAAVAEAIEAAIRKVRQHPHDNREV